MSLNIRLLARVGFLGPAFRSEMSSFSFLSTERDPRQTSDRDEDRATLGAAAEATLSGGEVSLLWSFIRGSIMLPEARLHLRRSWGMCSRHGAAWLIVESAFRGRYLHGPALLYDDLMQSAKNEFPKHGPWLHRRLAWRLHASRRCYLCDLGASPVASGFIREDRLRKGRDTRPWRSFLTETRRFWKSDVCGICARNGLRLPGRCRRHLCADIVAGRHLDLPDQKERVERTAARLRRYADSFGWEMRGTATSEDRAGLVAAIGWCAGWSELLALDRAPVSITAGKRSCAC